MIFKKKKSNRFKNKRLVIDKLKEYSYRLKNIEDEWSSPEKKHSKSNLSKGSVANYYLTILII